MILDSVRSGDASVTANQQPKMQPIQEVNSVELTRSKDSTSRSPWRCSDHKRNSTRFAEVEESLDIEIRCLTKKVTALQSECCELEQSNE